MGIRGKNLESISKDLSAVDWLTLTDDLGRMAVEAERDLMSPRSSQRSEIETLNESITELRDVINLCNPLNRFS